MDIIKSFETEILEPSKFKKEDELEKPRKTFETRVVYKNILFIGYWHLAAVYGLYLCCTSAKWMTILFQPLPYVMGILGITAGAHRLWAHKSYKATLPLQILLMIFNSCCLQYSIIHWVRNHRMHHLYSDTNGDPHNINRGYFFSHIGWLMMEKHPELKKLGKGNDISDLLNNPVLMFQYKYAVPVFFTFTFFLPTWIPVYFWDEDWSVAWHVNMLRYIINLNFILTINSIGHSWGNKPYDKHIMACQNIGVTLGTLGECFHNYHHVFPIDYRSSEFSERSMNFSAIFIEFFARIGWAYDLKTTSDAMIKARMMRTGDGSGFNKDQK